MPANASRWEDIRIINKVICYFVLIALVFLQTGCNEKTSSIESISIDFPHGETRLLVRSSGEAFLFYGELPYCQKVRNNTFDIIVLYKQLQTRLHDNVPREKWPNPNSRAGMVIIDFDNATRKDFLIFDEEEFAKHLFNKAKENIVGHTP